MKKSKLFISAMMLILLVSSSILPSFANTTFTRPFISNIGSEKVQEIRVGEKVDYVVVIKNESTLFAKQVQVKLTGSHPFAQTASGLTKYVGTLNPNEEKEIRFQVSPSVVAQSKIYDFIGEVTYLDGADNVFSNTMNLYVKINNSSTEPALAVSGMSLGKEVVKAGQNDTLRIHVKNFGDLEASNIKVQLQGMSDKTLVLNNDVDTKTLSSLAGSRTNWVTFDVQGGMAAEQGNRTLNVLLSYTDKLGNKYEKVSEIRFKVEGPSTQIVIDNISAPDSVTAGDSFDIRYTITNKTDKKLNRATVALEYPQAFISKGGSLVTLTDLEVGEKRDFVIHMKALDEATSETYHNKLKFHDGQGREFEEIVSIYVKKKGEDEGSKPKLIVDRYTYGELAMAGEEFDLVLDIKNTSTSEMTKNIKVTVSSEDNVFTPVDSSSSFFVKNIAPNEVQQHKIRLKTKIDANVKIYTVNIKMEYENSKGQSYDANKTPFAEQEALSVAVGQPIRLETGELIYPEKVFPGEEFSLEQEFYNMGKSTMYNLIIEVQGVNVKNNKNFVGNFDSGRSDFYSMQVSLDKEGENVCKLIYSFEDALGTRSSIEKEFTVHVASPEVEDPMVPGGDVGPLLPIAPEEEASSMNPWIAVGGGVLAVILLFFVVRKLRKNKKNHMEDDDE